jgi:hypothetical protein
MSNSVPLCVFVPLCEPLFPVPSCGGIESEEFVPACPYFNLCPPGGVAVH